MVKNKQKGGTGVESPPPRSFSGGVEQEDRSLRGERHDGADTRQGVCVYVYVCVS